MKKIVVVGAGNIGSTITSMLANAGDYEITVCDRDASRFETIEQHGAISTQVVDITDAQALGTLLSGRFAVLSAAPFHLTTRIADAAAAA
ncbi:MAG TPA: saccharopine dehydrogenase NADP-binding domain-containing protein, partial [Tianweitania sediminis]|nr:saccharopine dehydrogenase NADP-binding domain-containing protein [Tianweitania sediminis]